MTKNSGSLSPQYTSRQDDFPPIYLKRTLWKHQILLTDSSEQMQVTAWFIMVISEALHEFAELCSTLTSYRDNYRFEQYAICTAFTDLQADLVQGKFRGCHKPHQTCLV